MKKEWIAGAAVALVAAIVLVKTFRHDDWPAHEGKLRQTVDVSVRDLRRGAPGQIDLAAIAHYTRHGADDESTVAIGRFDSIAVSLVDAAKHATAIPLVKPSRADGHTRATITLPDVPDGDYQLHVAYRTKLGAGEVDVPVPLYTPARIHVITDRPLYEPGNLIRFRAVVLRARDLAPLDGRPGRWIVKDPSGEVLLEEAAAAGPWGVVAGTFPLDAGAPVGAWHVAWESNDARDEVAIRVEPFTLPRFTVEATADRPYYHSFEAPIVRGAVTYSSGAPVANATLEIAWDAGGDWPPPTEWTEALLPKTATTGANGRFELKLPAIPADLVGTTTLTARIAAVDPAGDRVEGQAAVLLAQDGLAVTAVTEVGDGLVDGFNNRVYLRVTTPDGTVVPDATITVKRAWQADDPGLEATLDADGVASLQLDPGPPVNVVIPPAPYRPPPRPPLVTRDAIEAVLAGEEGVLLADQVAMDRWLTALAPCAVWFREDDQTVELGLRVAPSGALTQVSGDRGDSELAACAGRIVRGQRLASGDDRVYSVSFTFRDPELPSVTATVAAALDPPDGFDDLAERLALRARSCLPDGVEGELPKVLPWSIEAGSKDVVLGSWIAAPDGGEAGAALACVQQRVAGVRLSFPEPAEHDGLGVISFAVEPASYGDAADRPQATTMLGYELLVSAPGLPEHPSTKLRLGPGEIPELRLRVSPVLAKPGDTIAAELIRGPSFAASGRALPKELVLTHLHGEPVKAKLDDAHKATFTIAPGTTGWVEISGGGVRGLVFVKPDNDLAVAVTPGQPTYAPGQEAQLHIQTTLGGKGGQAAVGLFGVDQSLGQLAPLPGADALGRVQPTVETARPAFGTLDGQALTLGRIRGANAAAATVLRVTTIPGPPALDAVVSTQARSHFDAIEELTDHFYTVLAELHVQARAWEASAPPGELMHPKTMAALWSKALDACAKRGEAITDAYDRKLRLSRLPRDLLALTDPRAVIVVGTRLPEDVEDWAAWVAKERP